MKTIGRRDKADFPELGLYNIKVKIDTGAYGSVLHSHDISEVEENGKKHIEFKLLDPKHPEYEDVVQKVKKYRVKRVKSSNGTVQNRFFFKTTIIIFGQEYPIELSLSDRSKMRVPVLLGRIFLEDDFVVDVSKHNLSLKEKKEKKKKTL